MSNTEMMFLGVLLAGTFGLVCLLAGIAMSAVIAWLAMGKGIAYNRGYADGRATGYSEGYQEGEESGFNDGACDAVRHINHPDDLAYSRAAKIVGENFVISVNPVDNEDEE